MAVKTNSFGVSRALEFFEKDNIYFGIGKSKSWKPEDYHSSEPVPSQPDKSPPQTREYTELKEVIGYRKADVIYLVVPHDGSTVSPDTVIINFGDSVQWKVVPPNQAIEEEARYIYLETTIQPNDFEEGTYRQVAVMTGLERNDDVLPGKTVLKPSEVKTTGVMEIIDNRTPAGLNEYSKETLKFVIKF